MRGSYNELPTEMQKQVDALIANAHNGILYGMDRYLDDWLREHISNTVLTCLFIARDKPKKGEPRVRASKQQ